MPLVISAKNLGAFALPSACERCLWVQLHIPQLPYQVFPGIFSSIDSYNKKVVHAHFDREGRMPKWLAPLGDIASYVPPPSYHKFSVTDSTSGVTLRGTADGIFQLREKGYAIVDYKTAKYTPGQETLLPVYETQLNAYAYIGNRVGFAPISQLALVYMEPVTDDTAASNVSTTSNEGFALRFSAKIVPVDIQPDATIPPLLQRARRIYDLASPPDRQPSCKDCQAMSSLIRTLS